MPKASLFLMPRFSQIMAFSTAGVTHELMGIMSKEPSRWKTRSSTGRRILAASTSMGSGVSRRGVSAAVLMMRPIVNLA